MEIRIESASAFYAMLQMRLAGYEAICISRVLPPEFADAVVDFVLGMVEKAGDHPALKLYDFHSAKKDTAEGVEVMFSMTPKERK